MPFNGNGAEVDVRRGSYQTCMYSKSVVYGKLKRDPFFIACKLKKITDYMKSHAYDCPS